MQINTLKLATHVAICAYIYIIIARLALGLALIPTENEGDSTSSWLGANIYDGGDSNSRIRVGVSNAGILCMLEIAIAI